MADQEFDNTGTQPESGDEASLQPPAADEETSRPVARHGDDAADAAEPVEAEPAEVEAVEEPVEIEEPVEAVAKQGSAGDEALEASESGTAEEEETQAFVEGMDWFIIHTYSGFENKVAESLRARAQAYHFEDRLGRILIPTEEVVELRNGKKVTSKRLLYPGYVMVQMAMDDEIWHHVKNTPRVTGFVGGGNTPVPLTADEVNAILFRQATAAERPRPKLSFEKNETVRIVDGPFASFQGKVDEINPERNTLRVLVTIFGRATPVELEFLQVEKIT